MSGFNGGSFVWSDRYYSEQCWIISRLFASRFPARNCELNTSSIGLCDAGISHCRFQHAATWPVLRKPAIECNDNAAGKIQSTLAGEWIDWGSMHLFNVANIRNTVAIWSCDVDVAMNDLFSAVAVKALKGHRLSFRFERITTAWASN